MKEIKTFFAFALLLLFAGMANAQVQNTLQFDGVNDYVDIGNAPCILFLPGSSITIEAWIKPNNVTNYHTIVARRTNETANDPANYALRTSLSGNTVDFYYRRADDSGWELYTSAVTFSTGVWQHVAVTYTYGNGASLRIYKNGILSGGSWVVGNGNASPYLTAGPARIGNVPVGQEWNGQIDELRIWNTIRTQQDIRENMYRELPNPAFEPNLATYYRFNETGGTSLPDLSSNSNTGTLINMNPLTAWVVSTAPIPYYTVADGSWHSNGNWAAAQNVPVNAWARTRVDNNTTISSNVTVLDLTISPGAALTVAVDAGLTVNGALDNQSGAAGLISKADATGMGSVIHNTAGVQATVEQYLTEERWHFVSSPIANAFTGVYTSLYLIEWSEPDSLWSFIVPVNIPMDIMKGYGAWASGSITGSTTVSFAGTLNTGNYNPTLTFNNNLGEGKGWNLLGNPYPSSLDWNTNWVTANVDATAYVWDGVQYVTWNRLTGIGTKGNGVLPATQSFFVKANNSNPQITVPQSERIHSTQGFYKSTANGPVFHLEVEGNGYNDKAILAFNTGATEGFDSDFDAYKLKGNTVAPQLYFMNGSDLFAVNVLPALTSDRIVHLGFETETDGYYTLHFSQQNELAGDQPVFLEDLRDNKVVNIGQAGSYTFTARNGEAHHRFNILFKNPASQFDHSGVADGFDFNISTFDRSMQINFNTEITGEVIVYNLLGQRVEAKDVSSAKQVSFKNMAMKGTGIVEVRTAEKTITKKVFIN